MSNLLTDLSDLRFKKKQSKASDIFFETEILLLSSLVFNSDKLLFPTKTIRLLLLNDILYGPTHILSDKLKTSQTKANFTNDSL